MSQPSHRNRSATRREYTKRVSLPAELDLLLDGSFELGTDDLGADELQDWCLDNE